MSNLEKTTVRFTLEYPTEWTRHQEEEQEGGVRAARPGEDPREPQSDQSDKNWRAIAGYWL